MMKRMLVIAACALAFTVPSARAGAPTRGVQAPVQALAAYDDDRLRISCRRKVRRSLGPAKGRHTGFLRIAYVEQCVANGGKLA